MQPARTFNELRQLLSAAGAEGVIPSLRTEPLVWAALQEPSFLQRIGQANLSARSWTPGRLSLLAADIAIDSDALQAEPLANLPADVQRRSLALFEDSLRSSRPPRNLAEAGLLALALRERRRRTGTWRGLASDLAPRGASAMKTQRIWQSAIACAYGLTPDGNDVLAGLKNQMQLQPFAACATHALLSNPMGDNDRIRAFAGLIIGLPLAWQVEWLQSINSIGRMELAAQLSSLILESCEESNSASDGELDSWSEWVSSDDQSHLWAAIYQFAGQIDKAQELLSRAQQRTHFGLAVLRLQESNALEKGGDWQSALNVAREAMKIAPNSNLVQAAGEIFLQKIGGHGLTGALEGSHGPLVTLASGWNAYHRGETDMGRRLAIQAVEDLLVQAASGIYQQLPPGCDFAPAEWVERLAGMGLFPEACALGEYWVTERPSDIKLLVSLCDGYHHERRVERAIRCACEISLLEPDQPLHFERLATLWEELGNWSQAAAERSNAFDLLERPQTEDRLLFASSLLRAGRADEAEHQAGFVLQSEADNAYALTLLGMARARQDDLPGAVDLLRQATERSNDLPLPWTELAKVYEQMGDNQAALDTLRAGLVLHDQSAEVLYGLGNTCLRLGMNSEALSYLRLAASLDAENPELSASLAKTMNSLGHTDEALDVIISARDRWPELPQLSFQHAQLLTTQGRDIEALASLEVMLEADTAPDTWVLTYGQILLNVFIEQVESGIQPDYSLLNRAQHALQQLLTRQPDIFLARLLLAEVVLYKGHADSALSRFRQLMEEESDDALSLRWRVQAGIGEACFRLGQIETALVAFQSAVQDEPEMTSIWRRLAETYHIAQLYEESEDSAATALQQAPNDLRNLTWYAGFMRQLGRLEQSEQALRHGIHQNVDRADLVVQLADVQIRRGEVEEARESLGGVAHNAVASARDLRKAAYLFLDLGSDDDALHCLERACEETVDPGMGAFFEKACLLFRAGDFPSSLNCIKQAQKYQPDRLELHLAEADLLARLGNMGAALTALEQALHSRPENNEQRWDEALTGYSALVPVNWQRGNLATDELNLRYAMLLRHHGQIDEAAERANETLAANPDDLAMRFFAAELAFSRMDLEHAVSLVEASVSPSDQPEASNSSLRSALCCLRAEIALATGKDGEASDWLAAAEALSAGHPRLIALKLRRTAECGDLPTAESIFDELRLTYQAADGERSAVDWAKEQKSGTWFADAAIAAGKWQEGLDLLRGLAEQYPALPGYRLAWARGMVLAGEQQMLCEMLSSEVHAPRVSLGAESAEAFAQALQPLAGYEPARPWKVRGQAIYTPSEETLQALGAELPLSQGGIQTYLHVARLVDLSVDSETILAQFPNQAVVHAELALTALSNGDMVLAETAQQAVALAPRNPLWHALYAHVAEANNELNMAYDALSIALSLWPDEPRWQAWAGELADNSGAQQEAVEHWIAACQAAPSNMVYCARLGRAYLSAGQYDLAAETLQQVVECNPNSMDAWVSLARTLLAQGQPEQALEAVQHAMSLDQLDARPFTAAGEVYLALKDPFEALHMAEKARELAVHDEQAILLQSRALVQLEEIEQAQQVLADALMDGIGGERLQVERMRLMRQKDGSGKLRGELERLVKIYPSSADLLTLLAFTLADCGEAKSAEHYANISLRQRPAQPDLHLLLGFLHRRNGQLDQSVYHFSTAVELAPKDLEAYLELGKAYHQRREEREALLVFQQAMALSPEDFRPFYQAALMMRDSKDYENAEQLLRRAAELAPNDLNIRRQLGAVIALNLVHHSQETNSCQ